MEDFQGASDGVGLDAVLHLYVAFDWGQEVDLEQAARLAPAEPTELARRTRTPTSIAYRPTPLRFNLPPLKLDLAGVGKVEATVEATLFDFAAVSVAAHVPLRVDAALLGQIAAGLAQSALLVESLRHALEPLHRRLLEAIQQPYWSGLSEEYIVFQIMPASLPEGERLLEEHRSWIAGLVRLEAGPLGKEELQEATRQHISYSPHDLFVCDWSAALLVDRDCDETLQTIEFANVQLLELRHIDGRIDERLQSAYRLMSPLARSWLPFWRTHAQPLRALGELKLEASELFERSHNGLKLMGDQYLARVYRLLSSRFHLEAWEESIRESLGSVQETYQVLSDQAASYRTEFLELIVIVLIALEIILALWRH